MPVKISIVIVSYNVRDLLRKCLQSLLEANMSENMEMIVVDNYSSDGSVEMIKKEFPVVKIIDNTFNAGFSGANNQGIEQGTGDYFFLLNPDTEISKDSLVHLYEYAEAHAEVSIVAPRLLNSDGSVQMSAWRNPRLFDVILETFFLHLVINIKTYPVHKFQQATPVDTASGAALFFSRKVKEKIKGLDPELFWMEDVDLCYRASRLGPVMYLPTTSIIHHSGKSTKTNYHIPISNQIISKLKFFKKHSTFLNYLLACVFSFIHIATRILMFLLFSMSSKQASYKFKAYLYTLKKFFRYVFLDDRSII